MKGIFIITTATTFLFSLSSIAQVSPVFKAGIVHTSWKGDATETITSLADATNGFITTNGRTGFYAGAGVLLPLGDKVKLEPSLNYTQRGYQMRGVLTINDMKIDALQARATSQMHYIDLPVLLHVQPVEGLAIFAGPQLSYLVKNQLRADVSVIGFSLVNARTDITEQFNRWDAGVAGGLRYTMQKGLGVSIAYERGFNRLDRNENFRAFNEGVKLGLTFQLQ